MVHRIAFRVASEESLDFWEQRVGGMRDDASLQFEDPEGLSLELVLDESEDEALVARHPDIPEEHAIRGFDAVRAYGDPDRSRTFLETLGFEDAFEARGERRGGRYIYDEPPAQRGAPGAGTVHHVA